MTVKVVLERKQVKPADILSAAATLSVGTVHTCNWVQSTWVSPAAYLEWAKKGLMSNDHYGMSNAITYAKRATCRVIDGLMLSNHLRPFLRKSYPAKADALREIRISVPEIVHELVIDPRNVLEHQYAVPERTQAEHAVQLAELFLRATQDECARAPIVALAWNVLGSYHTSLGKEPVVEGTAFRGFSKGPMLFVDVFADPAEAKIVYPGDAEVRYSRLQDFTEKEAVELALKLREHWEAPSKSETGFPVSYFREVKAQGGF
jgi:hypothetical protein